MAALQVIAVVGGVMAFAAFVLLLAGAALAAYLDGGDQNPFL